MRVLKQSITIGDDWKALPIQPEDVTHVDFQEGSLCMWFRERDNAAQFLFKAVATDEEIEADTVVGTALTEAAEAWPHGAYVFHVLARWPEADPIPTVDMVRTVSAAAEAEVAPASEDDNAPE